MSEICRGRWFAKLPIIFCFILFITGALLPPWFTELSLTRFTARAQISHNRVRNSGKIKRGDLNKGTVTTISSSNHFIRNKAGLKGIRPDHTVQEILPILPFHSSIEFVSPPSFILNSMDSRADHIVGIWDMFVKGKTLTIILSRYLEQYLLPEDTLYGETNDGSPTSNLTANNHQPIPSNIDAQALYKDIVFIVGIDTQNKQNTDPFTNSSDFEYSKPIAHVATAAASGGKRMRNRIGIVRGKSTLAIRCTSATNNDDNGIRKSSNSISLDNSEVSPHVIQDTDPYGNIHVSVDAVRICHIDLEPLRSGSDSVNYEVKVSFLGFKKRFNLSPIDRNLKTPSYKKKPTLFISSMVGNKPLITATEIVTWMRFHRKLGVEHFYLYYMYPLSEVSVEHIQTLNAYVESTKASLTIVQWHQLYMPLPSLFKKHFRGCSHLAILQSTLYRQKIPWFGSGSGEGDRAKEKLQERYRWMLENDIDDFIIPPCVVADDNGNSSKHSYYNGAAKTLLSARSCVGNNPMRKYLQYWNPAINSEYDAGQLPLPPAILFENSYFYLLHPSIKESFEGKSIDLSHITQLSDWKTKYMIKNLHNVTLEDLFAGIIVRETNLIPFAHRPKLIYNVDEVLLAGPHRLDVCKSERCEPLHVGIYLHYLKESRGRGIELIQTPAVVMLEELVKFL